MSPSRLTKHKQLVYAEGMYRRGFTIVELLIVIVIVAILAAISIVSYSGITTRSQATAIANDFKMIEKALHLYQQAAGFSSWPIDSDATYWTGNSNPTMSTLITAQPTFREFLPKAPAANNIGTTTYYAFDNDLDTYNGCSASLNGVNIFIANVTNQQLAQAVDDVMDDGNLSCGRVRGNVGVTALHYNISLSP